MKYAFIEKHRGDHAIRAMCRILGVAPSGFYAWIHRPQSDRAKEDQRLLQLIRTSWLASGRIYGSPRIFADLREAGERIARRRVARIMRENGIRAVRGYKRARFADGGASVIAPNRLQRNFDVTTPDHAWVTDITYLRTWLSWLYLAVVIDLYSRRVVGWSMKSTMERELVIDALLIAIWRRKPRSEVLIHSDQGAQYGSDGWLRFCRSHGLTPSMSRRGNCHDNAVAESFFSSLKKERIGRKIYRTRTEARAELFDYIEVLYNRKRRHSHLGGLSPEAFEEKSRASG